MKPLDRTPHNTSQHDGFPRKQQSLKMNSELKITKYMRTEKLPESQQMHHQQISHPEDRRYKNLEDALEAEEGTEAIG